MPLMPRAEACGDIVTLNRFCLRIPEETMLCPHGDPMQQACVPGAMANFVRGGG